MTEQILSSSLVAVTSIVAYDSMCRWISQSESLADCKDIVDKSAALKEYARRIKNTDAERKAVNVRLIAERRYGELLKRLARATPAEAGSIGGNAKAGNVAYPGAGHATAYEQALADTGVSRQAANRYEALADVPKEDFYAAISDAQSKPSARALIEKARDPKPQMPDDSLWIWGRMRDFERDGFANKSPQLLVEVMTESMRADVARIAPIMADFFGKITEVKI